MQMPDPSLVTGLFGGTFDPPHLGHVRLAQQLLTRGDVAQVVFLPAAQPPHKRHRRITAAADRLAMLALAVAEIPGCFVSDLELQRPGPSYTIDTVQTFAETFGPRLRLVLGMDSLRDLHLWHRSAELVAACSLLIYRRPGCAVPELATLTRQFGPEAAARLAGAIVDGPETDLSSTAIRARIRAGQSADDLLPPPVWRYIQMHHLYT